MTRLFFLIFILFATTLFGENRFSLGVGGIAKTSLYEGVSDSFMVIPSIEMEYYRFYIKGLESGVSLLTSKDYELNVILKARMDGYKSGDSSKLRGMGDRERSLDGGLKMGMKIKNSEVSTYLLHDLLDKHKGYLIDIRYSYKHFYSKGIFIPYIGVEHISQKSSDYYYGVRSNEILADRIAHNVGNINNFYFGTSLLYFFNSNITIFANSSIKKYEDAIKDSPIVDESEEVTFMLLANYRF